MRTTLAEEELKAIKSAMNQCWSSVAHDVEAQYKRAIPASHAVEVLLDLFHPGRQMCKIDAAIYAKFEMLSLAAKKKLAREVV